MKSHPRFFCLTFDIEADYANSLGQVRLFEEETLLERFIGLIRRTGCRVTGFVVTSLLERYGPAIRRLAETIPIEFALHSHHHDTRLADQREEIELAQRTFRAFFGYEAIGYRAPIGAISAQGIGHLMDLGFLYDASVFPSIRPGRNGYWNTHLPIEPFWIRRGDDVILEFPFPTLPHIRLNFGLPWIKLYGIGLSSLLMRFFPPPLVLAFTSHPHDLYPPHLSDGVTVVEKYALLRNSERGFLILETMIERFRAMGYRCAFLSEIREELVHRSDLPTLSLQEWRYYLFKDFPWRHLSTPASEPMPK